MHFHLLTSGVAFKSGNLLHALVVRTGQRVAPHIVSPEQAEQVVVGGGDSKIRARPRSAANKRAASAAPRS